MKKLKFAFWLSLIGFFALLIYQNLDFFSARYSLQVNLGFYNRQTPQMTNGAIMASFVGISILVMLIFYLSSRFETYRAKKTIRSLTRTLDESAEMISNLKQELEMRQQGETASAAQEVPEALAASSSEAKVNARPATSA